MKALYLFNLIVHHYVISFAQEFINFADGIDSQQYSQTCKVSW